MIDKKIGFVGAGRMAESLIKGLIKGDVAKTGNIYAADPDAGRREAVKEITGKENVRSCNRDLLDECDVVLLCVKPDILQTVATQLRPSVSERHLLISIAPGITLKRLEKEFGTARLIRAMPNTPAMIGRGATAFAAGQDASDNDAGLTHELFSAVGICIQIKEDLMDAVTGLSGSGPAYAFMAIQALSDGGVKMGLTRTDATALAAQTMLGAAEMVLVSGEHPEKLKDSVTTPGGTTIEGVHALESLGLRNALISAVTAAAKKSSELGKEI